MAATKDTYLWRKEYLLHNPQPSKVPIVKQFGGHMPFWTLIEA
jgi:hypothetical protein